MFRTAPNRANHSASGRITTLSGGACGAAWAGSPTAWNKASASGRSTTPATVTCAGDPFERLTVTLSPGTHVQVRRGLLRDEDAIHGPKQWPDFSREGRAVVAVKSNNLA